MATERTAQNIDAARRSVRFATAKIAELDASIGGLDQQRKVLDEERHDLWNERNQLAFQRALNEDFIADPNEAAPEPEPVGATPDPPPGPVNGTSYNPTTAEKHTETKKKRKPHNPNSPGLLLAKELRATVQEIVFRALQDAKQTTVENMSIKLEQRFGRRLGDSSIYPCLSRLKTLGFAALPVKYCYAITSKGAEQRLNLPFWPDE